MDRGTGNVLAPGQGGGRQDWSVNKHQLAKKVFCHAWCPQTRKASLSSRYRLQKRLQCNVAGSSLARDKRFSYTRRWLTSAASNQVLVPGSRHSSCALIINLCLWVCAYIHTRENVIKVMDINKFYDSKKCDNVTCNIKVETEIDVHSDVKQAVK